MTDSTSTTQPTGPNTAMARLGLADLGDLFSSGTTPALSSLIGSHRGRFAGPWWLRAAAPILTGTTGMRGWSGKEILTSAAGRDVLDGFNLVTNRSGVTTRSIPVQVTIGPSRIDGADAVIVRYPDYARFPWRNVTDELRLVDDHTYVGLTFGIPGTPRSGAPFLLSADPA